MINSYIYDLFERNSSKIDFCEINNYDSEYIEYNNTISSYVFCFFGIIIFMNNLIYSKRINYKKINYSILLFNIGLFSAYFHATLSEFGHIMDVMAIWFLLLYVDYILFKKNMKDIIIIILLNINISLIIPFLCIVLLFIYGFYINNKLNNSLINKNIYNTCKILFFISLVFWILDFHFCDYLQNNYMPTHFIFHIIIAFMAYKLSNIFY